MNDDTKLDRNQTRSLTSQVYAENLRLKKSIRKLHKLLSGWKAAAADPVTQSWIDWLETVLAETEN